MVTGSNEWKILEWDENPKQTKCIKVKNISVSTVPKCRDLTKNFGSYDPLLLQNLVHPPTFPLKFWICFDASNIKLHAVVIRKSKTLFCDYF